MTIMETVMAELEKADVKAMLAYKWQAKPLDSKQLVAALVEVYKTKPTQVDRKEKVTK